MRYCARYTGGSWFLVTAACALGTLESIDEDARQRVIAAPGRAVENRAGHDAAALAADDGVQRVAGELCGTTVHADDQARRALAVPDAPHVRGADERRGAVRAARGLQRVEIGHR